MQHLPEFPFPVDMPDGDDPFYGHPSYPHGMVLLDRNTKKAIYTIVMNFDLQGSFRVWVPNEKRFMVLDRSDCSVPPGARVLPMTAGVSFLCLECGKANDLTLSGERCSACIMRSN